MLFDRLFSAFTVHVAGAAFALWLASEAAITFIDAAQRIVGALA